MPDRPEPGLTLQRLYDSEINACIEWVWDGGVQWRLGDEYSGWKADGKAATVALAVLELAQKAVEHYPKSEFATWWKGISEKPWWQAG